MKTPIQLTSARNGNAKLWSWFWLCMIIFFTAFSARYYLIKSSPALDEYIDLKIYIKGGQLIKNGVNPYDFSDQLEIREKLRKDPHGYDPYFSRDQQTWNYYSSGNLPGTLLYFGLIEHFANGDPVAYRLTFAIIDSVLSVLVFLFITQFWTITSGFLKFGFAILLGAFNPVLLHHGTLISEDKGMQIALMIACLIFAKRGKIFWSAFFAGLAISFKGIGVFLIPLCLYYIVGSPSSLRETWTKSNLVKSTKYALISIIICILFFIPFLPDVLLMMQQRLILGTSGLPQHSSIWRIPLDLWPLKWELVRSGFLAIFVFVTLFGYLKRKIDFELLSAAAIVLFVDVLLNAGSLDRMNIGFLSAILIAGTSRLFKATWLLATVYSLLGFIGFIIYYNTLYVDAESYDAIFSMAIVLLFTMLLIYTLFSTPRYVSITALAVLSIIGMLLLFNIQKKVSEAIVVRTLHAVGQGTQKKSDVKFSEAQEAFARALISANPQNYNDVQKFLVFGIPDSVRAQRILYAVGLGELHPDSVVLSETERKAIESIISRSPRQYNNVQKSLIDDRLRKVQFLNKILVDVGLGKLKADSVTLLPSERRILDSIVSQNPDSYNQAQKSLIRNH